MDERNRAIVSRKMAIEASSVKNRLMNRNRSARSGHAVSAPSRYRTFLRQHFASPNTVFITRAEFAEHPCSRNVLPTSAAPE
jgi:hypothetical protein